MGLPSGTVTFVFTDLEGSTRRWEAHPAEMAGALARHDAIVRGAVGAHGGTVFSTMGDGMAAVFPSAREAVRAVLAAQQALGAEVWGEGIGPSVTPRDPSWPCHRISMPPLSSVLHSRVLPARLPGGRPGQQGAARDHAEAKLADSLSHST